MRPAEIELCLRTDEFYSAFVSFSDLLQYNIVKVAETRVVPFAELPEPKPLSAEVRNEILKTVVKMAMPHAWVFGKADRANEVDVMMEPKRRVIAARDYKKGELRLVAYSLSVGIAEASKKPTTAVLLNMAVGTGLAKKELYISPPPFKLPDPKKKGWRQQE